MRKTNVKTATATTAVTTEVAPALTVIDGKAIVTSLHIAQVFGKVHKNILRDIEDIRKDCPAEFSRLNFEPRDYTD
jgi:Rha family phage regulatory protein